MRRFTPIISAIVVIAVVALIVASSGGASKKHQSTVPSGGAYGGGAAAAKPPPAAANSAIDVRSTALGRILVDAKGRTLYLFEADKADMSNCSGACLSIWPAYTSGATPRPKGGAVAAKIGTIAAAGGKRQVTYNGHPLYYYAPDQKPGDTTGQGLNQFGAAWYVLAPSGSKIDNG